MKKLSVFLIATALFFTFNGSFAQESTDIRNSVFFRIQKGIYNRAIKYNDVNMAVSALYNLCTMDPQNDSLLYSLAYHYFDNQNYVSSILTLNDVLMLNPGNMEAMEMKAVSLERVGAKERAIEQYESLYLNDDSNLNYLYKAAVLQYELKRYQESKTNADILLNKDQLDEIVYYFPGENNQQQEVPLKASLHNLKGLIAKDQGNMEEAKEQFTLALEIVPEFNLAKQNLEEIESGN